MRVSIPLWVIGAATVVALTASTGATPVASADATPQATPSAAGGQQLAWSSCGPKTDPTAQCAQLRVPLDWAKPKGQQITLAVARHPATDQARKVGTLMFLPGPGASVVNQVATPTVGGLGLAEELVRRFDIVGIDPRGGGLDLSGGQADATLHSQSLACTRPFNDPAVTRLPRTGAEFERLAAHNRAVAGGCIEGSGQLVGHLDAGSQARDAEALRVALGEPTLSWFAWTYASLAAQTYAHLYPQRVRAMVIDGPLDHSVSTVTLVRTQARATQEAFQRFVAWCDRTEFKEWDPAANGPSGCPLHGQDVAKLYDDMIAQVDREPLVVPGIDHPYTGEELRMVVMYALQNGTLPPGLGGWFDVAAGIQAIRGGDPSGLAPGYPNTFGPAYYHPYRATGCLDFRRDITGYRQFQALRREIARLAPHTSGLSDSWDYLSGCLDWPYPSTAPRRPVLVHDAPPVLLVTTRHSPLAPYPLAVRVARQIKGSVVLNYEGDAHIAYFNSKCVREQEQRYLVTAAPPPAGTSCTDGK